MTIETTTRTIEIRVTERTERVETGPRGPRTVRPRTTTSRPARSIERRAPVTLMRRRGGAA